MTVIIPSQQTKQWTQPNTGDVLGTIVSSKNMNFDKKGYARLGRRSSALLFNATRIKDITSISTIDGVTYYVTGGVSADDIDRAFTLDGNLVNIAISPVGGDQTDGLIWQGRWYVTQDTSFSYFDGTNWTTSLGTLTTGKYHPMCVHEGLNYLAIGDIDNSGSYVKLYNSSHTLITTITLPLKYEVRWIRYNNNYLYIGTRNTNGDDSMLFIADGTSTVANYGIRVPSIFYAFSGCIYKGVLVIIGSNGQLLKFNGQGFEEIAHFPVYDTPYIWYKYSTFKTGKVAQRGMVAKGDKIYLNVDGYVDSPGTKQLTNQPSGLWCYDPNVGLYHMAGLSSDTTSLISSATANTSTDTITVSSVSAPTGTKVLVQSTDIGGLTADTFYFLIYLSPTTFKLATSYANAIAGTAIHLTSVGASSTISINSNSYFGESLQGGYQPGAVALISDQNAFTSTGADREYISTQILFGGNQVNSATSITNYTLQTLTVGENRGHFVTTKIQSQNIEDVWQAIYSKYGNIFEGNDKVVVKYRTVRKQNYPLYINPPDTNTWLDSTSFLSTKNWSGVLVGDEIEITAGRGAGCCVHILSKQIVDGGKYVIKVDEAIPSAVVGDVSTYMFVDNWIKIGTSNYQDLKAYLKCIIAKTNRTIEFKIELRGVSEPYIEELQIANAQDTQAT